MLFFISKVSETANFWFGKGLYVQKDEWTNKSVKNYGIYNTWNNHTLPTLDGKLPEEALWKFNQPGYLRPTAKFVDTAIQAIIPPKQKVVEWVNIFFILRMVHLTCLCKDLLTPNTKTPNGLTSYMNDYKKININQNYTSY